MYTELLKKMFLEMVLKKDLSKIPVYYHREFLLYTNGEIMDYQTFYDLHKKLYPTSIEYQVEYDERTLLEEGTKVAGRIWITTKKPQEPARKIELLLIAEFKEHKIHRIWELTYPDWSQLLAFQ